MKAQANETRADILAAAEAVFTEKGFAAAHLEDVAQRVGLRRPSLLYHFRSKRELYDAVLESIFGELGRQYEGLHATGLPLPERIDAIIGMWVDYVAERPSVARILLRETAGPGQHSLVARHTARPVTAVTETIRLGQQAGLFHPIDPMHFILAVVGATIFVANGAPAFVRNWTLEPLGGEQLKSLRTEVITFARRLLEIDRVAPPSPGPAGNRDRPSGVQRTDATVRSLFRKSSGNGAG
jgi:TetR/AcrR family transcriptional regulator